MATAPRLVISNCTMRKAAVASIHFRSISQAGSLSAISQRWNRLVRKTPPVCTAETLYKGRSILDARTVAAALEGRMFVVSAGLGLIPADCSVPSYDMTVVAGSDLAQLLAKQGLQPSDWWDAMTKDRQPSLATLVEGHESLLALPASYLRMLRNDLASIPVSAIANLRIFTSVAGRTEVPPQLSSCLMPYDERLETVPQFDGTRADFPQRAMRHFVECLDGHTLSQAEGQRAVQRALSRHQPRVIPARVRMSDEEISGLLRKNWSAYEGRGSRLLRYLRDEAKVSCEQGRFRALWRSLVDELEKPQ